MPSSVEASHDQGMRIKCNGQRSLSRARADALPLMPISLVMHRQMATDPATVGLKLLIEEIYADRQVENDTARTSDPCVKGSRMVRRHLADADAAS